MTDLATIEASWDRAAVEDAMFNIIMDPSKANGGWTPDEFFAHGRKEIDAAMAHLAALDCVSGGLRALDFGCGVGRVTQALAPYYRDVYGVDISIEMVVRALAYARERGKRINFWHSCKTTLGFSDHYFDLVYSMVVLQHMPQDLQQGYLHEFFRVLKPGGVAMIHIPDGPNSGHADWPLSMYGVPRATTERWIAEAGGRLVDVEDLGRDASWQNYRYTAVAV